MKKLSDLILILISMLLFVSCVKQTSYVPLITDQNNLIHNNAMLRDGIGIRHAGCWDEWGRASRDCGGWGLCNYEGCWYWSSQPKPCCNTTALTTGEMAYNVDEGKYILTISLSHYDTMAVTAASEASPLYIDLPIILLDSFDGLLFQMIIDSGSYNYLSNVGTGLIGGYRIPVLVTQE